MLEEGFDVNKPPMFKGVKYDYWKEMMIAFFESTHIDMSDVVEKGNHIPLDATKKEIPKDKWEDDQKFIFLLKDTLAITYKRSSEVKHIKLSLLTRKYELFGMKEGEDIQTMFGCFQTILNELHSLESSFKAFAINDTSEEESDDDDDDSDEEDDELSLITRKITKMWKSKNSSKFNSLFKRSFHKKEEIPIVCYECKKSGHFKSECPNLEKSKDKKKKLFKSIKKSLMSTWEELDNSSSNEDTEEEANMCLMAYAPTSEAKPALDAGTDDEDPHPDDTINSDGEERKLHLVMYKTLLLVRSSRHYWMKRGHEALKKLPYEIVKLYEEIETLRDNFGKFVGGHEALNKIIKVMRLKCKDLPEKGNPSKGPSSAYQHPPTNKEKGPKKIWVPKSKIILVANLLDSRKETPAMKLVELPKGKSDVGEKWVFINKLDETSKVVKNKASLVAKGYSQQESIDYAETFALVARLMTIRILLSFAAHHVFEISMMGELKFFLGLQIKKTNEGIYIHQTIYVKELLKKFKMDNAKPMNASMHPTIVLGLDEDSKQNQPQVGRVTPDFRNNPPSASFEEGSPIQITWLALITFLIVEVTMKDKEPRAHIEHFFDINSLENDGYVIKTRLLLCGIHHFFEDPKVLVPELILMRDKSKGKDIYHGVFLTKVDQLDVVWERAAEEETTRHRAQGLGHRLFPCHVS
ncbi:Retrovirus-related Pol polyprotein from transposon TNT 1-94 [Glycine soja]|uniref:Retrovirus-related Pol polyprotein from transposon TNT 1-94 n=1 Tax=Glycine soja TaxID=3848 RepID=A0A445EYR4_GLYSO|nr:Retrovirus-related Pol polyprotein from transposon TNT 1-94 [Glycine soja]